MAAVGASCSVPVTITNTGSGNLVLGTPALSGTGAAGFTLDLSTFTTQVAPGSSTTFLVIYTPSAEGVHTATLTFTHDAGTVASPFTLTLTAETPSMGGGSGGDGGTGAGCIGTRAGTLLWPLVLMAALVMRRRRVRA
jgi:hypothetical protein